jgi:ABC-type uncharacterized transport system involved in gliding motility auxiliary subunit
MGWPKWVFLALAAVSAIAWIVFSLDRVRLWLKKRSTQYGLSLAITAVMAIAILGAVNYVAVLYNKKADVTANQLHTLSDQSKHVAQNLKEGITLRVWTTSLDRMSANLDMRKFLENYKIASKGKIKVEIKNPNEDRAGAAKDNVKRDNLIVIRSDSGREARIDNFSDTKGEEQITNGIIQAIKGGKKTVCFVSGHGELSLSNDKADGLSFVRDRLNDSSYTAKEINIATENKIPDECEALVLAGPRGDALDQEVKLLDEYMHKGGKVLALLGPSSSASWRKLVEPYGVKVRSDLIIDPRVNPPIAIATKNYSQDVEIVKSFNQLVVFPEASSLSVPTAGGENGANVKTFVSSESYTYAKPGDLKSIKTLQPGPSDMRGPLPVAVLITKPVQDVSSTNGKGAPALTPGQSPKTPKKEEPSTKTGSWKWPSLIRSAYAQNPHATLPLPVGASSADKKNAKNEMSVILIGNSSFVANSFVTQAGNMDLFLNSINYLLKDQDLIGIRPREIGQASLEISQENLRQVVSTVFLISLAFLVGGVMASRRKSVGV